MLNLQEIHKPTTIAEAVKLIQQPNTVALAGGTSLIASKRRDVNAVVDLSALGLVYIKEANGAIALGATTTLAMLAESPMLRALANGIVAQAAHRSAASIRRNQATVAGTLISEPDGVLAVALLALDAQVTVVQKESRLVTLDDFLLNREHLLTHALVTELSVPMKNPRASLQTVARTPSDKPIVSVVASARMENGIAHEVRLALGGVAETAVRAVTAENTLAGKAWSDAMIENAARTAAAGLSPHSDYRGSAEYRQEMAQVLLRRALKELQI